MGWNSLIASASSRLAEQGVASPRADAREIAEVVGGGRIASLPAPDSEQRARFESMVRRRAERVPLQHVTGRMYFRFLELASRPGCFIVRPETELVAEEAIAELRALLADSGDAPSARPQTARPVAVDLCTGSGAIALALATEVPGARVIGVELSDEAFSLARENNARYGDVVELVRGDARTALGELEGKVDVVVANPPYVPPTVQVSPEVDADPDLALWGGGTDGTEFPLALIARAVDLLAPGGILVMEHAENQAEKLVAAALAAGFADAHTGYDFTGRPRWLRADRPGRKGRGD
ncbi:peptide chain release factor N(5)-glutamine methyltransferase [Actinomycetaceae bacterium L2_0104]